MDINDKDAFAGAIIQNLIQSKMEYVTQDDEIKLPVEVLDKHINDLPINTVEAIKKEAFGFYNLVINSRGKFSFDSSLGFVNLYPFIKGMIRLMCSSPVMPIDDGLGYLYHINLPEEKDLSPREQRKLSKLKEEEAISRVVDENYLSDKLVYQNIFSKKKDEI